MVKERIEQARTSYDLSAVLTWCFASIDDVTGKALSAHKFWLILSLCSGFISALWTIPLAYGFGAILVAKDILGLTSHNFSVSLGIFFAMLSFPASVILFGRTTNLLITRAVSVNTLRFNNKKLVKENVFDGCVWLAAMINAIPPAYLTFLFLEPYLGRWSLFFILITYVSSVMRNVWSLSNLADIIYYNLQKHICHIKQSFLNNSSQRLELRFLFTQLEYRLKQASLETINNYLQRSSSVDKLSAAEQLKNIAYLNELLTNLSHKNKLNIAALLLGIVGAVIGAIATYPFYTYARDGALLVFPFTAFGIFCGVASLTFTGSLYLYSTCMTFKGHVYRLFTRGSTKFSGDLKTLFILLIAFCGAGPLTMMAYHTLDLHESYAIFIITCAFVCAFVTKIWVIYNLFEHTKKETPEESVKSALGLQVKKLTRAVDLLDKAEINKFYQLIIK